MNRYLFCLAAVSIATTPWTHAIGAQSTQATGASRAVKQYTIEQFMKTVRIGGAAFSPGDRDILFHNNQSGIFNVYAVPVTGGQLGG